jgi:hypothetical protein
MYYESPFARGGCDLGNWFALFAIAYEEAFEEPVAGQVVSDLNGTSTQGRVDHPLSYVRG